MSRYGYPRYQAPSAKPITDPERLYKRYRRFLCRCTGLNMTLDMSRMMFRNRYMTTMKPAFERALTAMARLEDGGIANPDERRMVGHYWLRNPELAPDPKITETITHTIRDIKDFARDVHQRRIEPPRGPRYTDVLVIGIGGSALGPQLIADALTKAPARRDRMAMHFIDNTDPDGMLRTLGEIGGKLKSTLVVVTSKSGGTAETRNGMEQVRAAFAEKKLRFADQAIAITGEGSKLDKLAVEEGWLKRFPMWDWVGGRTSVMAAVGLVPMALQGINIAHFLEGAAKMDHLTRNEVPKRNPAAMLALMWYHATNGAGEKAMVILPYKDRLVLFSRYLQQLVMESLGKKEDLDGNVVHQGITVYGNKGSTDQHAYVQQLRDGLNDFFVTFINVLEDTPRPGKGMEAKVEDDFTAGDFLTGFLLGTRDALYEAGRESITITIKKVDAKSMGALIALYERAVGFYATMVNINAYHQPGVEAGKKAAASVLQLQTRIIDFLSKHPDDLYNAERLATAMDEPESMEKIQHLLDHLAANKRHVRRKTGKYGYLAD